eukprot:40555-Chlamydomonas_euryale.AAC.2
MHSMLGAHVPGTQQGKTHTHICLLSWVNSATGSVSIASDGTVTRTSSSALSASYEPRSIRRPPGPMASCSPAAARPAPLDACWINAAAELGGMAPARRRLHDQQATARCSRAAHDSQPVSPAQESRDAACAADGPEFAGAAIISIAARAIPAATSRCILQRQRHRHLQLHLLEHTNRIAVAAAAAAATTAAAQAQAQTAAAEVALAAAAAAAAIATPRLQHAQHLDTLGVARGEAGSQSLTLWEWVVSSPRGANMPAAFRRCHERRKQRILAPAVGGAATAVGATPPPHCSGRGSGRRGLSAGARRAKQPTVAERVLSALRGCRKPCERCGDGCGVPPRR